MNCIFEKNAIDCRIVSLLSTERKGHIFDDPERGTYKISLHKCNILSEGTRYRSII
jgi:hypothetical protein